MPWGFCQNAQDRRRPWCAGIELFEEVEERSRRIPDGHQGTREPISPQVERSGGARRPKRLGERRNASVIEHADDLVACR